MKKSDFISAVLDSPNNTVFTTAEQVEVVLEVFESLGMLPPDTCLTSDPDRTWEEE